ncbi:hypothetical protein [Streptomyces sp. NBC_00658]|uniref:recombination directionality factor n=1 Tax=Streptomyces sp. NBC_00658 TaxID=2975800 RepID=UPI0038666CD0
MGQEPVANAPIVGSFHVARQSGGRPLASSSWRVVTKHHSVATAIAARFAGSQVGEDALEGNDVEILTGHERVPILLDGMEAVSFRMVSQGAGETFHVCDGVEYLEPESSRGRPCGCPHTLRERKAAAATGRGPRPEVQLRFRLAELPDLGMFSLRTGSWEVVEELPGLERALRASEGPVECDLRYAFVGFTTLSGVDVSYRRPNIELGESPRVGMTSLQLLA